MSSDDVLSFLTGLIFVIYVKNFSLYVVTSRKKIIFEMRRSLRTDLSLQGKRW